MALHSSKASATAHKENLLPYSTQMHLMLSNLYKNQPIVPENQTTVGQKPV